MCEVGCCGLSTGDPMRLSLRKRLFLSRADSAVGLDGRFRNAGWSLERTSGALRPVGFANEAYEACVKAQGV